MSSVVHGSLSEFLELQLPNKSIPELSHEVYTTVGDLTVPVIQLQGSALSSVLTDLNGLSLIGFKQVHSVFNDTYCLSQGLVVWVPPASEEFSEGYWKPFTTFDYLSMEYSDWCESLEKSISIVLDSL